MLEVVEQYCVGGALRPEICLENAKIDRAFPAQCRKGIAPAFNLKKLKIVRGGGKQHFKKVLPGTFGTWRSFLTKNAFYSVFVTKVRKKNRNGEFRL